MRVHNPSPVLLLPSKSLPAGNFLLSQLQPAGLCTSSLSRSDSSRVQSAGYCTNSPLFPAQKPCVLLLVLQIAGRHTLNMGPSQGA